MKTILMIALLTVGTPLALTGCDRTVATQETTKSGPDGTSTEKKTVTEHSDGTVTQSKEKTSSNTNP